MGDSIVQGPAATASDSISAGTTKPSSVLIPLLDDIRELIADDSNQDPVNRAKLLSKIHALNLAAEAPLETIFRIGYQSWQTAAIRVALDLGLFHVLEDRQPKPVTAEELASKHNADVVLVGMSSRECTLMSWIDD